MNELKAFVFFLLILSGCAVKNKVENPIMDTEIKEVNTPKRVISTNSASEWTNLGVTLNGNQLVELDKLSITQIGTDKNYQFRSRTTIFNPSVANFENTLEHRQSINTWSVNCKNRVAQLIGTRLYDANKNLILDTKINKKGIKAEEDSALWYAISYVCDLNHE